MSDHGAAIARILQDCEQYWRQTRVPGRAVAEMKTELEAHLADAAAAGKAPDQVVGPDLPAFAEAWAREQRPPTRRPLPSWDEATTARSRRDRWIGAASIVALVALGILIAVGFGNREEVNMDDSTWIWIWLTAALVLGFGEMLTAGFFLLPFSVGAVAGFLLAIFGIEPWIQFVAFLVVSVIALFWLRRFVQHEDENQPAVGSNRYIGSRAMVKERIDRLSSTGRVLMEAEDWRATTTGDPIEPGTEVMVVDVTGSRLIVEPVED